MLYWTETGSDSIWTATLDGSNVEEIVTGLSYPVGIAAIPEPSTALLLASGLAGLAARSRRRAA
jgi:hypothetical protein